MSISSTAQMVENRIDDILNQMDTEEKIYQLINNTFFTTGDNTRLGIPGFQMSDGPHGVRFGGATVFPTGIAMAATWDLKLVEEVGEAMGEEFWGYSKHQQLGPCIDLCRDPRNGRSPESGGEDPYLAGKMAAAVIKGIQKTPVIATAKHFNLVNRQQYRNNSNAIISDRWLMEHYGLDFMKAVQEGGVFSVMNAYNLINGTYCSESNYLLNTVLRDRWGFPFYVVSDWGAVHDSEKAINAGTDICMGSDHYEDDLPNLLSSGDISETTLNEAVRNVLRTKLFAGMLDNYPRAKEGLINSPEHQELSLEAARKVMVLLKNEDDILPLNENAITKIALIGPSANKAQLDGFGSSWVEPIYSITPRQGIENIVGRSKVSYAFGCQINSPDTSGFATARAIAKTSDYVIFVGGLDDTQEGEGYGNRPEYDRKGGSVQLPGMQQELINELAKVNENLIVVIKSGGICALNQSIENIKGLIYAFYPGQEGGNAIAETIFGHYNPGGKLPVTMPKTDNQLPPWNDNFNDDFGCGYRWFDRMNRDPQFVFGFGLSYTEFEYTNLTITDQQFDEGEPIRISFDVTNVGNRPGDEVAQLYTSDESSHLWMPEKQLKGFQRLYLQPGETQTVTLELTGEDFYYWDEMTDSYKVEAGMVEVMIGGSSDDLPLKSSFEISENLNRPDLVISKILTIPRFPAKGDTVHFLALVRNIGSNDFKSGIPLQVQFGAEDNFVAAANYSDINIPTGGMRMIEANEGFWVANQTGPTQLVGRIDSNNMVTELIESNNTFTQEVDVYDSLSVQLLKNLALFKPVSASSSESSELTPENAVDGNAGTRWASRFFDPQEFMVDLQNIYDIVQIRIQWETAFGKSFTISVSSDSENWEDVVVENNGDGNVDEYSVSTTARYIRYTGLTRGTQWGHSFWEFEVYGKLNEFSSSTNDVENELSQITLYPNPITSELLISADHLPGTISVNIYNIPGQLMISKKINTPESIDVSHLDPGAYIVQIQYKNQIRTLKVVKSR